MAKSRIIYQVAVGDVKPFYEVCLQSVEDYCARIGADHVIQRDPLLRIAPLDSKRSANALRLGYLPIYEKENAFSCLADYDRVLILDADVYVKPAAPDIFDLPPADFSGVIERDMPLTSRHFEKIRKYSRGQYGSIGEVDWKWNDDGAEFFNMGVMLLDSSISRYLEGQTPEQFIRRPEFERFVNGEGHFRWSTDQTLLNYWVKKSGMAYRGIDWRWNALYGAVRDVSGAYFVHFFLADKLPRKGAEIPDLIAAL